MNILVVEDHPLSRDGLCCFLAQQYPESHIDEAENYEAIEKKNLFAISFDLIFLDLKIAGKMNTDHVGHVRTLFPHASIIIFSECECPITIKKLEALGINGYISKATHPEALAHAIECAMNHIWVQIPKPINPSLSVKNIAMPNLTKRQYEILHILKTGISNKEIARKMNIDITTVRSHVSAILETLNVKSRTEAVYIANQKGLFNTEEDRH
jgi:DNA-binding NarL/FixJ family response regulator